MIEIAKITRIDNKSHIAILDTSSISFLQRLHMKGLQPESVLRDYDLILINTFPIRRTIAVRRRVLGSSVDDHADALALSFPDPLALVYGHAFSVPV